MTVIDVVGRDADNDATAAPIPKIIWSFWHDATPPLIVQRCVDGWRRLNPGYRVELLHAGTVNRFIQQADLPRGFDKLSNFRKADWLRLALVSRHGGVWMDASILLTRSLDWLVDPQRSKGRFTGFYLEGYTTRRDRPVIENWCFAAPAGNVFVTRWCQVFTEEVIEASELQFLQKLESKGIYEQVVGAIDNPKYLAAHVAAQYVLHESGTTGMRLIKAEDSAYLHHAQVGWKRRTLLWLILIRKAATHTAPLIKLRKKERERIERYLRWGFFRQGSIASIFLK
ncbi:MAG: capsular polysaccharide synthesis protein [Aquabacterium sp.]|uniref:glycosyltransferase family 32 protein n=1 Tax=Aquabacterium sp. TaxID=1872578 RepID=UPI003BB11FC8